MIFFLLVASIFARPAIVSLQTQDFPVRNSSEILLHEFLLDKKCLYFSVDAAKKVLESHNMFFSLSNSFEANVKNDCPLLLVANVPRTSSTWFLSALFEKFSDCKHRLVATHHPFLNYNFTLDLQKFDLKILIMRNPYAQYASFAKMTQWKSMIHNETEFFERWKIHNEYWIPKVDFLLWYEWIAASPAEVFGKFLNEQEKFFSHNAHLGWLPGIRQKYINIWDNFDPTGVYHVDQC